MLIIVFLSQPAHLQLELLLPGLFVGQNQAELRKELHASDVLQSLAARHLREISLLKFRFGNLAAPSCCATGITVEGTGWFNHEQRKPIKLVIRSDDFSAAKGPDRSI